MQRACDSCGKQYEAKRASSKYCGDTCRKRGGRGHLAAAPDPAAEPDRPHTPLSSTLVDSTRRQLEDTGRLDTWLGQQALAMAAIVAAGRGTPAGLAAASRELRETMTAALRGADTPASAVMRHRDEVARRRARAAGA